MLEERWSDRYARPRRGRRSRGTVARTVAHSSKLNPRGLVQPCLVASCQKSTRNQPISNHHTGIPTVGMTVGSREINRVPTLISERRRSVLRIPTAFQPLYIITYSWDDGWFCENQTRFNLRILKHMVRMTLTIFFYYSLWLD